MSLPVWITWLLCGGATSLLLPIPLAPQDQVVAAQDPVAAGREAFEVRGGFPWYDAAADGLQPVEVEPHQDDPQRLSEWANTDDGGQQQRGWIGLENLVITLLKVLAWIGLGLVLGTLVWALVWALKRAERPAASSLAEGSEATAARHRVEELPMPIQPGYTDLLAAAKAFREAGELGKAVIYAFAHQLVELDKHHVIQLTKGKTNRQYLRELGSRPELIDSLIPLMLAFEDVFFGHHEMTPQRLQRCWQHLERFHRQLEQVV